VRLATVSSDGRTFAAVLAEGRVHEVPRCSVGDLVGLGLGRAIEAGRAALEAPGISLEEVVLELPYHPPSVRDFVTFERHVEGVRRSIEGSPGVPDAWYDAPTFYFTNPHALYGPGTPIRRPASCHALDFELEVGVVVGRDGCSLSEAEAAEAVFGYTIVNDWSARDLQAREMQVGLGPAKGKDFATSIGPWIVTADELAPYVDPDGFLDLGCRVFVNDTLVGQDRLSGMGWTFPQMISYASRDSVVRAGDLLGSGTTGGGCLAELWGRRGSQTPPPLEPGDVVRMEVEAIGELVAGVEA
jgi:2-keto-4-pentenoate hydratase/2-oxohepta-3-ene-1,7-dioic acid hydratase in catechol pathway